MSYTHITDKQRNKFVTKAKSRGYSDDQIEFTLGQINKRKAARTFNTPEVRTEVPVASQQPRTPARQPQVNRAFTDVDEDDGMLKKFAKGVVRGAEKYGRFVGESVVQGVRAGIDGDISVANPLARKQRFEIDKVNEEIAQLSLKSREAIAKARQTTDMDEKARLLNISRNISSEIEGLGSGARKLGDKRTTFFENESELDGRAEILETGAQRTAGAASYAIPGSIGAIGKGMKATEVVARVAGAGALAGGLQGAGEGQDLDIGNVATGVIAGGATAGALSGASQAIRALRASRVNSTVGKKLADIGSDFKLSSYTKSLGRKPTTREGGHKLLKSMQRAGIKPGGAEDIIFQADDILLDNADRIFDKADEFTQKGISIDKSKILDPLEVSLKNSRAAKKGVVQRVMGFVKEDLDKIDTMTPAELYALKADYGTLGNWNKTMSADDQTMGKVWKEVYNNMNDILDDVFTKNGYDEFREVNKLVSTAINAKNYAMRVENIAPNTKSLGLMDLIGGGVGYGLAQGPVGVVTGAVGQRVLNSPKTAQITGDILEKAGSSIATKNISSELGNQAGKEVLSKVTQRGATSLFLDDAENLQEKTSEEYNEKNFDNSQNHDPIIPQPTGTAPKIYANGLDDTHPWKDPISGEPITKQQLVDIAYNSGLNSKQIALLEDRYDRTVPTLGQRVSSLDPTVMSKSEYKMTLQKMGVPVKDLSVYGEYWDEVSGSMPEVDLSDLTEKQRSYVSAAKIGEKALKLIEDNPELTGIGKTTLNRVGKVVGTSSTEMTQYRSATAMARTAVRNALLGANMSDKELESIMDAIPEGNEDPKVAADLWKAFISNTELLSGVEF